MARATREGQMHKTAITLALAGFVAACGALEAFDDPFVSAKGDEVVGVEITADDLEQRAAAGTQAVATSNQIYTLEDGQLLEDGQVMNPDWEAEKIFAVHFAPLRKTLLVAWFRDDDRCPGTLSGLYGFDPEERTWEKLEPGPISDVTIWKRQMHVAKGTQVLIAVPYPNKEGRLFNPLRAAPAPLAFIQRDRRLFFVGDDSPTKHDPEPGPCQYVLYEIPGAFRGPVKVGPVINVDCTTF
jgi:hypothetical protein